MPKAKPSSFVIRTVTLTQPFCWLHRGWRDLCNAGWLSWAHGVILTLFSLLFLLEAYQKFWLLAGAVSGFMVVAPVLATSLYAFSRALERGEPINIQLLKTTWAAWQHNWFTDKVGYWSLVHFGVLLALAATGWVLCSAALITLFAPAPVRLPMDFVRYVVLAKNGWLFELWLLMGGILVAPVFASSVVAMPLLLDRRVTVMQAVLASWQTVIANPIPMALWAALIMGLTVLAMSVFMMGLIVVIPLLGHASWHAYRDLVDVNGIAPRISSEKP